MVGKGRTLRTLVVVLSIAGASLLSGCVVRGGIYGHPSHAPPAPRYVEVEYRSGYVYTDGRWVWGASGWYWTDGYYVRERPGYYYSQGHWSNHGGRHVWVDGRWGRGSGGVHVRDHRGGYHRPAPVRGGARGVWTRDHRSSGRPVPAPRVRTRDHRGGPGGYVKTTTTVKTPSGATKKTTIRRRDHR